MQAIFPDVKKFNPVQSAVLDCALYSRKNMLICAPTSSGKTNIAVFTILNTMAQYMNGDGDFDLSKFKMVYIAPMKALVAEVTGNLSSRLKGITVKELTGDMQLSRQQIN
jgi:pre-mRNA-splicing helicase BRR2